MSKETPAEKKARLEHAATRTVRRLSAWNIFQREGMNSASHTPETYRAEVKALSQRWKNMTKEEKEAYQVQAAHEQIKREELANTPHAPKSSGEAVSEVDRQKIHDLEKVVGRSACKKLSARRLLFNDEMLKKHPVWESETQFADSNLS